jgi:hypothetical protein
VGREREGERVTEGQLERADLVVKNARQLLTFRSAERARSGPQMSNPEIVEDGAVAVKEG